MLMTSRQTMKVAAAVLATTAVILGIITRPAVAQEPATPTYIAVIDAGSSGTRLTLFADDPESLVPIQLTQANKRAAAISSFASAPDQAGPGAVTPLLDQLQTYLTEQRIDPSAVPVAFLATAGMRNVRRDDPAASQAILASTAAAIERAGHPVAANRILPGIQEAVLAWLDTNALTGTLQSERRSIGVVEIGGASAQVAFRSATATGRGVQLVEVEGKSIPVVAASYLGLGGDDARALMQSQNDAGSFCFPNNAAGAEPAQYVPTAARPVAADTANYSWQRCAEAYRTVITSVGSQRTAAARIAPWDMRDQSTFARMSFVGLGSLPFTYNDLGIAAAGDPRAALQRSTTRTCTGPNAWDKVQARYVGRSNAFAATLCSTGTYQFEFVFGQRGIGIASERFTLGADRFPRSPAWTSGYAITVLDP